MTAVPNSTFDTRQLPAGVARDRWQELIGVLFDAKPLGVSADDFSVELKAWLVDSVGIAHMKASPHHFSRSRNKIARDGMDGFLLQFYTTGESQDRFGNYTAKRGDLYVLDMAQPMSTLTSPHAHVDIAVPRRLLAPLLTDPDNCHQRVLDAKLPLVTLLRGATLNYVRNLSRFSAPDAQAALGPLLGLAAAAINGSVAERDVTPVKIAVLTNIKRYIEDRLLDPSLTLEAVLGEFSLTRRSLYRLFEPMGGFQAYIRKRRLECARQALKEPDMRSCSVSDIAMRHGFPSAEHFSRSFRREFGFTPREARFYSGDSLAGTDVDQQHDEAWSRWIADIGR